MFVASSLTRILNQRGFVIIAQAVDEDTIGALVAALDEVGGGDEVRKRGEVYAIRNLLAAVPAARALALSAAVRSLIEPALGPNCFAVRAIFFDKTAQAAWKVAWHQDLSIAVRRRVEIEGFGAWSVKAGVAHTQPPAQILERMLTLRLHLDDCDETNGPLKVFPGSHLAGRLAAADIRRWQETATPVSCLVPRGGILLMRPLLLHASSAPEQPRRRRVIHLEFASDLLPGGLEWQEKVLTPLT